MCIADGFLSFVDQDRRRFKAKVGISISELPLARFARRFAIEHPRAERKYFVRFRTDLKPYLPEQIVEREFSVCETAGGDLEKDSNLELDSIAMAIFR